MLLMDQVAERARLVIEHGAAPHPEMRAAIASVMGKARADVTQDDIDTEARKGSKKILEVLERVPRFVIERRTVDLIGTMLDQPERLLASSRHLFAPASEAWIELETEGGRIGLLVMCAEDSLVSGRAKIYIPISKDDHVTAPVEWDLTKPARLIGWLSGEGEFLQRVIAAQAGEDVTVDLPKIGLLLLGTLAVLCTPRLYDKRQIDRDKLNRTRLRRGHWPLLSYHEVLIDLQRIPTVSTGDRRGMPRALHFVRAFLRIRLGRVELVRPHWRGDAQYGVKRPAYRVRA